MRAASRKRRRLPRKRVKNFVYPGLGFPIELRNVQMVRSLGRWGPDVNLNELSASAFRALAKKPARLTGDEVHFIRHHMGSTFQEFAELFRVTRQAVMKWERAQEEGAGMSWGTELALRLKILKDSGLSPAEFFEAHSALQAMSLADSEMVRMVRDGDAPEVEYEFKRARRSRKQQEATRD